MSKEEICILASSLVSNDIWMILNEYVKGNISMDKCAELFSKFINIFAIYSIGQHISSDIDFWQSVIDEFDTNEVIE